MSWPDISRDMEDAIEIAMDSYRPTTWFLNYTSNDIVFDRNSNEIYQK